MRLNTKSVSLSPQSRTDLQNKKKSSSNEQESALLNVGDAGSLGIRVGDANQVVPEPQVDQPGSARALTQFHRAGA